jgi:hypothetical protein
MNTRATSPPPLKIEDLMERWGVSKETILEHVKKNRLPYWDAGTGKGRRPEYRFRLADVEAWEASRVRTRDASEPSAPAPIPASLAGLWDGTRRLAPKKSGT